MVILMPATVGVEQTSINNSDSNSSKKKRVIPSHKKPIIFTQPRLDKAKEKLHENLTVQGGFAALDSFNNFLGALKTGFDYSSPKFSSGSQMHDFLTSPEGITIQILGSLAFAGYGWIANSNDDKEVAQQVKEEKTLASQALLSTIQSYDYVRDIIKMICWTQKGVRTVADILIKNPLISPGGTKHLSQEAQQLSQSMTDGLSGANISPLCLFAVTFGALGLLNRVYKRKLDNNRIAWQKKHKKLVENIKAYSAITDTSDNNYLSYERCQQILACAGGLNDSDDKIEAQDNWGIWGKNWGYASAAFGGTIDGIYMYLGVLTITYALNPYLYLSLLGLSLFYVAVRIITNIQEEKGFQDKLLRTQKEVELALLTRQVYLKTLEFNEYLDEKINAHAGDAEDYKRFISNNAKREHDLSEESIAVNKRFEDVRQELDKLNETTYVTALFSGLRAGLSFYATFTNILYAVSIIFAIASVTFPPWLLVAGVVSGILCLAVFVTKALLNHKAWLDHKNGCWLHKVQQLPSPSDLNNYKNSYILQDNGIQEDTSNRLYYIDWVGKSNPVTTHDCDKLESLEFDQDDAVFLTRSKIDDVIVNNGGYGPGTNEHHFYSEFKDNIETIKDPKLGKAELSRLQYHLDDDLKPEFEPPAVDMQLVGDGCRQATSAVRKAVKGVEFVANSVQVEDCDGKYHAPNEPMTWVGVAATALAYVGFYGARALGKVGRGDVSPPTKDLSLNNKPPSTGSQVKESTIAQVASLSSSSQLENIVPVDTSVANAAADSNRGHGTYSELLRRFTFHGSSANLPTSAYCTPRNQN